MTSFRWKEFFIIVENSTTRNFITVYCWYDTCGGYVERISILRTWVGLSPSRRLQLSHCNRFNQQPMNNVTVFQCDSLPRTTHLSQRSRLKKKKEVLDKKENITSSIWLIMLSMFQLWNLSWLLFLWLIVKLFLIEHKQCNIKKG